MRTEAILWVVALALLLAGFLALPHWSAAVLSVAAVAVACWILRLQSQRHKAKHWRQ